MQKRFSIVIVNWNSKKQLKECIDSVNNADKTNCKLNKIIVVDNASSDNSLEMLNDKQEDLVIIRNDENLGFGKACNQGAVFATGDFILFLNPDMLVFEDTFKNLFDYIEENDSKNIGLYGVQLVDENNNIQRSCARLPTFSMFIVSILGLNKINPKIFKTYTMEDWNHKYTQVVDQVMGSFFMPKAELFHQLNGFDERFFVYYEELDFSKRIKDLGYDSVYVIEAKAYHKGGGTSEQVKAKRLFYNTRSKIIYAFKNLGTLQGASLMLLTYTIEPITRILYSSLILRQWSSVAETCEGFKLLYKDTFKIISLGLKK